MNMILIKHGYTVALVRRESRDEFILACSSKRTRPMSLGDFIGCYRESACKYALNLYIAAARGESIDDVDRHRQGDHPVQAG